MLNTKDSLRKICDFCVSIESIAKLYKLNNGEKRCLLVSNGSTLSGAPLVLLEAANILKQNGYKVVLITEYLGPFVSEARKCGHEVIVICSIKKVLQKELSKINFQFVIVNTIIYYNWIEFFKESDIPVIWWLHEGKTYIDIVRNQLPEKLPNNVFVYCVSSWTERSLVSEGIYYDYGRLNYGCFDMNMLFTYAEKKTFTYPYKIAIIGNICERKNQIQIIDIMNILPQNISRQYELLIVGTPLSFDDPYYIEFQNRIRKSKVKVTYIDGLARDEMFNLYREIDIVLCCSLDDPLPVVITEGMMFGKIVIISSCTGHADFIINGVNGFKYDPNDSEGLINILKLICMDNTKLIKIGKKARETYEIFFTSKSFEDNLLRVIQKVTSK